MLQAALIGKVVSDPVLDESGKRSFTACRLAVNLKDNQVIKLVTYAKDPKLVKDSLVFVAGKLSKIDEFHLQLETELISPVDTLSPVYAFASGNCKFVKDRQTESGRTFYNFDLSSYDGLNKTYTSVGVSTSSRLASYMEGKRGAVSGTINTVKYQKKSGGEGHAINASVRELEITERKETGEKKQSSQPRADYGNPDNIPF